MKLNFKHHFDAAHRLENYQGLCYNLHGHRWEVEIEIQANFEERDMLIDFSSLKRIINIYDHRTILKDCEENKKLIEVLKEMNQDLVLLKQTPTAEHLSIDIHERIERELYQSGLRFLKLLVTVFESPNAGITTDIS